MRLEGPSGGLHVLDIRTGENTASLAPNHRILRSLNRFPISTAERLAIGLESKSLVFTNRSS